MVCLIYVLIIVFCLQSKDNKKISKNTYVLRFFFLKYINDETLNLKNTKSYQITSKSGSLYF